MTRVVTEAERRFLTHVTRWGIAGYPVRKVGRRWTWDWPGIPGPHTTFRTKREAVASVEARLEEINRALAAAAQAEAIERLRRQGYSEAEIERAIAAAMAEEAR